MYNESFFVTDLLFKYYRPIYHCYIINFNQSIRGMLNFVKCFCIYIFIFFPINMQRAQPYYIVLIYAVIFNQIPQFLCRDQKMYIFKILKTFCNIYCTYCNIINRKINAFLIILYIFTTIQAIYLVQTTSATVLYIILFYK